MPQTQLTHKVLTPTTFQTGNFSNGAMFSMGPPSSLLGNKAGRPVYATFLNNAQVSMPLSCSLQKWQGELAHYPHLGGSNCQIRRRSQSKAPASPISAWRWDPQQAISSTGGDPALPGRCPSLPLNSPVRIAGPSAQGVHPATTPCHLRL